LKDQRLKNPYGQYSYLFEENIPNYLKYKDLYNKHQTLVSFEYGFWDKFKPFVLPNVFVAPCATIAGNVEVYDSSSIWYGVVIRGDTRLVRIGSTTNIQDGTVITEALEPLHSDHDGSTIVGHNVTVGHNCTLKGCTIEDYCLIGMDSVLPEGSYVEHHAQLAAGTVLQPNQRVLSGQLWGGNPAKFIRDLTHEEQDSFYELAKDYYKLALLHKEEYYLNSEAYKEAEERGIEVGYQRPFPW